jgi:steroid delta-isomerase-like uncharacterized protein
LIVLKRTIKEVCMPSAQQVVEAAVEAFNSHDPARIAATYADDAVMEAPGDVRLEGPEAITEYAMGWLNAFPDSRVIGDEYVAAGDRVVHEFTFVGTHDAPLHGPDGEIPATHRRLEGRGAEVYSVAGDKIAAVHLYFDQVQVLTQLGLMPEPATARA